MQSAKNLRLDMSCARGASERASEARFPVPSSSSEFICMIDSQPASLIEHIQNWAALKLCGEYEYISLEAWR